MKQQNQTASLEAQSPAKSLEAEAMNEQAIIEALQYYLRQSALTQRNHLPRWACW